MTRRVIAIEGIPTVLPGIWLTPGSLYMDAERVPVTHSFDFTETIGWARNLQRENHEVSVDVELGPGWGYDEKLFDHTFYATDLVEEYVPATDEIEARRFILSARVRAIAIVPIAAYPSPDSRKLHGT
jgi:hypothetical protein